MRRLGLVVASGALLFAVVIMCQQTWSVRWGKGYESTHRWFELILAVYFDVAPLVMSLSVAGLLLVIIGVWRPRVLLAAGVVSVTAVLLLATVGLDSRQAGHAVGWGRYVLPALVVALVSVILTRYAQRAAAVPEDNSADTVDAGDRGGT